MMHSKWYSTATQRNAGWYGGRGAGTALVLAGAMVALAGLCGCTSASTPTVSAASPQAAATQAKPPAHPYTKKHIYDEEVDPRKDIAAALKQAKREHKRVLVDFGGDWCGDCQVLDIYFHESPNEELLQKHYVLVHVFIGHIDKNLDIAEQYGVGIKKGVPALAVVDPNGKAIYAQSGQFEDMRHMDSKSVTEFLEKWKS